MNLIRVGKFWVEFHVTGSDRALKKKRKEKKDQCDKKLQKHRQIRREHFQQSTYFNKNEEKPSSNRLAQ